MTRENTLPEELSALKLLFDALIVSAALVGSTITFDRLSGSVQRLISTYPMRFYHLVIRCSPFTSSDLAKICAIAPTLIRVYYSEETDLRNHDVDIFRLPSEKGKSPNSPRNWTKKQLMVHFRMKYDAVPKQKRRKMMSKIPAVNQIKKLFGDALEKFYEKYEETWRAELEVRASNALPKHPEIGEELVDEHFIPKSITEAVTHLKKMFKGLITYERRVPEKLAIMRSLQFHLAPALENGLKAYLNVEELNFYQHQALALNALVNDGKNVVASTSTSSGKSMIYNIPIIHSILTSQTTNSKICALYLFPTKALAQDQKQKLRHLLNLCDLDHIHVETYDGDTPVSDRQRIRDNTHIIITNPDMLHVSILPHHEAWLAFLTCLSFIVIDEVHMYSGVLGSHVGLLFRRLQRILAMLGIRDPKMIACSATISNPTEHVAKLVNRPLESFESVLMKDDGSPRGEKHVVFCTPNESSISICAELTKHLVRWNLRTVVFCKIRKMCEIVVKEIKRVIGEGSDAKKVGSYRGGYAPHVRRRIEQELFNGSLTAVVATNALELGIDVGDLDVTIHLGFPYSLSSLWQQAGRAGRSGRPSLMIYIADIDPIDQSLMATPDIIFQPMFEKAVLDCEAEPLFGQHLQCAAYEKPIDITLDTTFFGRNIETRCIKLLQKDSRTSLFYSDPKYLPAPSQHFPIRCHNEPTLFVYHGDTLLEELEWSRAIYTIYEGAIYLYEGKSYLVQSVSDEKAMVTPTNVSWLTRQRDFTNVDAIQTHATTSIQQTTKSLGDHTSWCAFGEVQVSYNVYGHYRYDPKSKVVFDSVEVHADPCIRSSKGMWVDIPKFCLDYIGEHESLDLTAGIHAANHLFVHYIPSVVLCNPIDTDTEHMSQYATRTRPARLIAYDRGGPKGICEIAHEHVTDILIRCLDCLEKCPCDNGCAQCVLSSYCTEFNDLICKKTARILLQGILDHPYDI